MGISNQWLWPLGIKHGLLENSPIYGQFSHFNDHLQGDRPACQIPEGQLVGGVPSTPLKNDGVSNSWDDVIPNICLYIYIHVYIWKIKKCSKPPTRQLWKIWERSEIKAGK